MKKLILLLAAVALATSVWAQDTPKKPSFAGFVSNGFWDNWEITLGGGAGTALSNGTNQGSFGDRINFEGFVSSDYFPLFPQLGYFFIGAAIGKTAYREKKTLLPGTLEKTPAARFFCWCGRQSLFIYLLHQPIVYGLLELVLALQK